MAIDVEKVVGQNIVLVYDRLDGQALNRNELRQLVEGETTPTVIDAPEMIVVVKPPLPIVVQIGNRRVQVALQREAESIGSAPLWTIAHRCHRLVQQAGASSPHNQIHLC